MFDRRKYKDFAIKMLKGRWAVPVLMTLIITIVLGIFYIPERIKLINSDSFQTILNGDFESFTDGYKLLAQASEESASPVTSLIELVVQAILEFAALSVFLKMSRSPDKISLSTFFSGFNYWWKAFLGILWQFLWTCLWCFLFFIPGIIKYISYSQMFFIMNEFENVSVTKSMRISMIITRGHKWDIFVMALSFIGWDILAALSLGIGDLWLSPYKQMTYMNAFHAMLKEALENGSIRPEDLQ